MKYMQAVINNSALDHFRFASGRSYMMRSEKRNGSGSGHRSPAPGSRPPRKRKKKAGFFYKLFMMILLLTIWPLGLLMLWRRKVRWGALTKLLTSIVTLAACIVLLGFALTVDTGNYQYTRIQDNVNSFLDTAADTLLDAGDIVAEQAEIVYEGMSDFAGAIREGGKVKLANGIDAGVILGQRVMNTIEGWIATFSEDAAETAAPEEESEGQPVALPVPTEAPTAEPTAEPTPEPTPEVPTFIVKPAADATVYYNEGGKCYHMTSACGSMLTSVEHSLGETLEENNHRCSVCGTPEKTILDEEHIIWQDEEGIAHLSDNCENFAGKWKLLPAAEAIESDMLSCDACEADLYLAALAAGSEMNIQPEATAEPTAEPTEEPTEEPTAVPTPAPTKEPAVPAETANPESQALVIEAVLPKAEENTQEPTEEPTEVPTAEPTEAPAIEAEASAEAAVTEEPTEAPTAEPTAEPEPEMILPNVMLKPAGEATVYHSMEGKLYHSFNRCSAMVGSGAYTLAECAETHGRCMACGAPDAALISKPCLWMDADKLCHTSDTCSEFNGKYTLVLRDAALAEGLSGCASCGGSEYLVPNTLIDFEALQ